MKSLVLGRYALTSCVAGAWLAGCGGSQTPIGAPGGIAHRFAPTSSYRVLYSFGRRRQGLYPLAGFIKLNDTLYGTTPGGGSAGRGAVYTISTSGMPKVLHSFGRHSDGRSPHAGLIGVNGTLYGTTSGGGTYGKGTVYSLTTTGAEKVLHSFAGGSDGAQPQASLINVKGTLYGTTENGGSSDDGTVFSITIAGAEKVLHSFVCCSDGTYPSTSLIDVNGTLYGTTYLGGGSGCGYRAGCGTVYTISTSGSEKVLHAFKSSAGAHPLAGLIDVDGTLYGTTSGGGPHAKGTFYRISTAGVEKVLYSFGFHKSDGAGPQANFINVNDTLYGTTWGGGAECGSLGCGTVFSVTTTGSEKVLHSFAEGSDGQGPSAPLIDVNGTLYGTTYYGGGNSRCNLGCGTVFALSP